MNSCMILSTLLATVIIMRILFIIIDMVYYNVNDDSVPITKQHLRGMPIFIEAFESFERIHEQTIEIAINGGHEHKFKLCYENPDIIETTELMIREAFPDIIIKQVKNGTCARYKLSW